MQVSLPSNMWKYLALAGLVMFLSTYFVLQYLSSSSISPGKEISNRTSNRITGIKVGGSPYAITINPGTKMVYVADKYSSRISFIDGNSDRKIKSVKVNITEPPALPNRPELRSGITIDNATNLIYFVSTISDKIYVLDGFGGNLIITIPVKGNFPIDLRYSPMSQSIYLISNPMKNSTENNGTIFKIFGFSMEIKPHHGYPNNLNAMSVYPYRTGDSIYIINNETYINVTHSNGRNFDKTSTIFNGSELHNIAANGQRLYATDYSKSSIYALNPTGKLIKIIKVGDGPNNIAIGPKTNNIYVTNSISNSVSIIDGHNQSNITVVRVGNEPHGIAINPITKRVYVANRNDGSVSVINSLTNKLLIGISFSTNPPDGGSIQCSNNNIGNNIFKTNDYFEYDKNTTIQCRAQPKPYSNLIFGSWSGSLASDLNDTSQLKVTRFGTLTANFILAPQIPPEFYGVLIALIPSFFVPSIARWLNGRRQRGNLRHYREEIDEICESYKKSPETRKECLQSLDGIKIKITRALEKDRISESQYALLKDKISECIK